MAKYDPLNAQHQEQVDKVSKQIKAMRHRGHRAQAALVNAAAGCAESITVPLTKEELEKDSLKQTLQQRLDDLEYELVDLEKDQPSPSKPLSPELLWRLARIEKDVGYIQFLCDTEI